MRLEESPGARLEIIEDLLAVLPGKQLLIFDFDGTVADTSPLHAKAFTQVLSPFGISVNYHAIAGLKTLDAMRECITAAGVLLSDQELQQAVLAKQKIVRKMISRELSALPGVDKFLRWALPRYRLSMATSGSRETVELALRKLGYIGWFDPLVCADDVVNAKPDPEGLLTVLKITGAKAADALVFDDSAPGFAAARAAGLVLVDARRNIWQQLYPDGGCE